MKNVYLRISQGILFFSLQLFNYNTLQALCPYGSPSRQVAYDHYEVEMSRDSIHFTSQGRVDGSNEINIQYKFSYIARQQEEGIYYFGIRQTYASGCSSFSDIRTVTLKNSHTSDFILFPNPSNGIIGIKFDNIQDEKKIIKIFNSQAQKVVNKEIAVTGSFYQLAISLQKGIYWIRISDVKNRLPRVNQLFIK